MIARAALMGVAGVLLLLVGAVTLVVGLVTTSADTTRLGFVELTGGGMLSLVGAAVFAYFRMQAAQRDQRPPEPPAREE